MSADLLSSEKVADVFVLNISNILILVGCPRASNSSALERLKESSALSRSSLLDDNSRFYELLIISMEIAKIYSLGR